MDIPVTYKGKLIKLEEFLGLEAKLEKEAKAAEKLAAKEVEKEEE